MKCGKKESVRSGGIFSTLQTETSSLDSMLRLSPPAPCPLYVCNVPGNFSKENYLMIQSEMTEEVILCSVLNTDLIPGVVVGTGREVTREHHAL